MMGMHGLMVNVIPSFLCFTVTEKKSYHFAQMIFRMTLGHFCHGNTMKLTIQLNPKLKHLDILIQYDLKKQV